MIATTPTVQAFRSSLLHCVRDPGEHDPSAVEYLEDGLLLVSNGRVEAIGPAAELLPTLAAEVPVHDYSGKLIVPGFIDTHVHYPQTDMIASYGSQLLEWLNNYTFPTEARFADAAYAADTADFFIRELLRNGTTSALVLGTVHSQSVDAFFNAAQQHQVRMIAGKVLMDRNCPENLRDTAETGYTESKALIERWHGQGRLEYAITPRFAPTSTELQLQRAGQLAAEHPTTFIHTHVAENVKEVEWVAELFPKSRSYLDVYDQTGLLRDRTVLAHCIHLDTEDRKRLAGSGAAMAFCPTSNLFLGSGLFDLSAAQSAGALVGLGTDVGAGTSFSMLQTLSEAYKVSQMAGQSLSPYRALYLATLGSAKALYIDDHVGNFAVDKEADFVVLDWESTPLLTRRMQAAQTLEEKLFALFMLGDDRAVSKTFIQGHCAHERDSQ